VQSLNNLLINSSVKSLGTQCFENYLKIKVTGGDTIGNIKIFSNEVAEILNGNSFAYFGIDLQGKLEFKHEN
jgi:hypothetical protein